MVELWEAVADVFDRLKDVGVLEIEVEQGHVSPVVSSALAFGFVPLDEVVALLILAEAEKEGWNEVVDAHVVSSA